MTYTEKLATSLGLRPAQVQAAVDLFDSGNTIPFIARYRKEATQTLDEEQLRQIQEGLAKLRALDDRRQTVLASIDGQGLLTESLRTQIEAVDTLTALEDLYLPYKPKRRTKGMLARENGLQGLADIILAQPRGAQNIEQTVKKFINDKITTVDLALEGARDIVAETINDHPGVRSQTRSKAMLWGSLTSEKIKDAEDPRGVFQVYYDCVIRIDRIRPHQVLAINRGEDEKILRVKIHVMERDWVGAIQSAFRVDAYSPWAEQMNLAIADCAERLLLPAIERDVRRQLTETAWKHGISVFSKNLGALLSQPPLSGRIVLGVDPGFRTGCKLAVVDATGKVLATGTIYPHEPQKQWKQALEILEALVTRYGISLISIGNGTASRETESLVANLTRILESVQYVITNEAGASVYSANPLARAELPDLDVSLRGAVSIARRVQDALAELVKIDPRSIGVGMYQHDVDQGELTRALNGVVERVVNKVGVDANTASPALLAYVSGIGPKLAEKIVAYRDAQGRFNSREALRKVSGLGSKAFEQCAGFLRIRDGSEPLDVSAIHPESYPVARKLIGKIGMELDAPLEIRRKAVDQMIRERPMSVYAQELGVGEPTLQDILEQLVRPGRDPRSDMPLPVLRSDVLSMDDLSEGMRLKGTVRNAVDFGAFIDIGVKQDGLLHRSQLPSGTVVQPGDVIDVEILAVEKERGRISLRWAGDHQDG
jgi:uncharacterized protein